MASDHIRRYEFYWTEKVVFNNIFFSFDHHHIQHSHGSWLGLTQNMSQRHSLLILRKAITHWYSQWHNYVFAVGQTYNHSTCAGSLFLHIHRPRVGDSRKGWNIINMQWAWFGLGVGKWMLLRWFSDKIHFSATNRILVYGNQMKFARIFSEWLTAMLS